MIADTIASGITDPERPVALVGAADRAGARSFIVPCSNADSGLTSPIPSLQKSITHARARVRGLERDCDCTLTGGSGCTARLQATVERPADRDAADGARRRGDCRTYARRSPDDGAGLDQR